MKRYKPVDIKLIESRKGEKTGFYIGKRELNVGDVVQWYCPYSNEICQAHVDCYEDCSGYCINGDRMPYFFEKIKKALPSFNSVDEEHFSVVNS